MKLIQKIILILILFSALFLRAYKINSFPAINSDEAAIGYNAYSLLQTGKDEHGVSWPLHFESFGEYKLGASIYLAMPFVKILGLNLLAIRLPNLILSILTILFLYKLVLLISKSNSLALLSSMVLTLSPWHIHFSRGAWESSIALSFIIIGIYFFYKSIEEKFNKNFSLFIIFFSSSIYTYNSALIISPLLALTLFIIYFSFIKSNFSKIILPLILGIIITIPIIFSFLNNGASARFNGIGITADKGPLLRSIELLNQHQPLNIIDRTINNRRVLYFISWIQKYTSHFDLNFLTISGDYVPRSKSPEIGQIYLIELPFLILGLIFLFKPILPPHKLIYNRRFKLFILAFLLITPLASSLTFQAPSALRSLSMVIPLSILISIGIFSFFNFLIKNKFKKIILIILILFYSYNIAYFFDSYFFHYEKIYPTAWQYGFNKLVPYLEKEKNKYENVFVTNKYDQPYILFLFYSKYPPQLTQKLKWTKADQFGFKTVNNFDRYIFKKIDWNNIPSNSLVITSDENVPIEPNKIINFPNSQSGFKIYSKL